MKEAEWGTSRGQAHTKQWSSGNLVLIFTHLGIVGAAIERDRETGIGSRAKSKGLMSCQLDSSTPFGEEQTNRGISWANSVYLSQR